MSDLLGVPAFGGGGVSLRSLPVNPGQTVPDVAAIADDTSATLNKGINVPGQNGDSFDISQSNRDNAGAYAPLDPRDALAQRQHLDVDTLTGPTPAFQASLLEVESDLRNVIARVEAKRAQISDATAIAPAPQINASHNVSESQASAALSPSAQTASAPNVATQAPQAEAPIDALDREAAYSGRAATPETPYSKPISMDLP